MNLITTFIAQDNLYIIVNTKKLLTSLLLLLPATLILAQSYYQLPGTRAEHISDRWYVLGYDQTRSSSIRNIDRRDMMLGAQYIQDSITSIDEKDRQFIIQNNTEFWAKSDQGQAQVVIKDEKVYVDSTGTFYYYDKSDKTKVNTLREEKKGVFGILYNNRANFYEINTKNFTLRANPVLNIHFGREGDRTIIRNTRGAELRGTIDDKIYYYTRITDTQRNFLEYTETTIDKYFAVPGHGAYKDFQSAVLDDFSGYDYSDAEAYVGLDVSKNVALELGHGQHFIGNGMRSLLLSNTSDNYFYVKLNTRIWKLQYQNIWAELNSLSARILPGADRLLSKKYMATHYLSYKPTKKFEIGLFETVIFNRENQYELQYLNPVILYRVVEFGLGSPDNVLLGMNANYTFGGHFQAYGQMVLDEFNLTKLNEGNDWWGNKFGYQIGMKYYNAINIDHLDLQLEYNTVRPYTYTHSESLDELPTFSKANYSHQGQPLAHPLGANFKEILASAKYQLSDKLYLQGRAMYTKYGEDGPTDTLGNNILIVSTSGGDGTINMDEGNKTGQGLQTDIMMLGLNASYQFMYNYYLDVDFMYRKSESELASRNIDTKYIGVGLRVNMGREQIDY